MFKMILIDFFFPCSSLAKQKRNETKTWVMPTRCDMHTVVVYYVTHWRHGMKGEYIGFKTKLFPSLNLISVRNFVIFQSSLSVPWKKILLVKQNFLFFLVAWALKVSVYFITDHRIWFNCPGMYKSNAFSIHRQNQLLTESCYFHPVPQGSWPVSSPMFKTAFLFSLSLNCKKKSVFQI